MNERTLKSLFKPYVEERVDLLELMHVDRRHWYYHKFWFECKVSTEEECVNTDCPYNFVETHEDELYVDLMEKIKAEKKNF